MLNNGLLIIIGIVATAILGVFADWLLKRLLPEHLNLKRAIVVVTVIGALIFFIALPLLLEPDPVEFTGRIIDDNTGLPIGTARVLLDLQNNTSIVDTDSTGVYRLMVNFSDENISGRLRVEADDYENYNLYITLLSENPTIEEIRLKPLGKTIVTPDPATDTIQETMEGKVVTVFGRFPSNEANYFAKAIKPFEEKTGIDVQLESSDDFIDDLVLGRVEAGKPPDVAALFYPGTMQKLAEMGKLIPLPSEIISQIDENYAPSWKELGSFNGETYGVFYGVSIKSLVWYPKEPFKQAGYTHPTTWDELISLSDQMIADGNTPWCIGLESGGATGWVATDWIEDILLRTVDPHVYDQWVNHEIPFNDSRVKNAFEMMGQIWLDPNYVSGGASVILNTNFGDASTPMFDDPPSCWLHRQGNWITEFYPEDVKTNLDNYVGVFVLPSIHSDKGTPLIGGGNQFVMFNDRPEVRTFMQYLTTGESGDAWARSGGALFPHKDQNLDAYPTELERNIAKILMSSETIRFDGSDLMPSEVGTNTFWKGTIDYIGGKDVDTILDNIEASWPK